MYSCDGKAAFYHYIRPPCHMITQEALLIIISVLNLVVLLLNIFVETVINFFQDSLITERAKQHLFCNIINVFTVTFNASVLNKNAN